MQLIKHAEYRTVDYFGEELEIPAHHCYVATNEDGFVFSFYDRPECQDGEWEYYDADDVHCMQYIALFDLQDLDAKNTLVEYLEIKMSII